MSEKQSFYTLRRFLFRILFIHFFSLWLVSSVWRLPNEKLFNIDIIFKWVWVFMFCVYKSMYGRVNNCTPAEHSAHEAKLLNTIRHLLFHVSLKVVYLFCVCVFVCKDDDISRAFVYFCVLRISSFLFFRSLHTRQFDIKSCISRLSRAHHNKWINGWMDEWMSE